MTHPRKRRALSGASETMLILAIESSCDETSVAIVEDGRKILANVVASSAQMHNKTGGVIPEVAAREQLECMIPVLNEAMKQCNNRTMKSIDAIAVTAGPGLIGSLLVGVETAKTLSFMYKKPLIPVNHILAHAYANWLDEKITPGFPAIYLVISGGHTELFLIKGHDNWKWIGGTLDDASGEAFDKTARLLGIGGYPGGPAIAAAAAQNQKSKIKNQKYKISLPRPMIGSKDFNFSFSGLKTAVIREINKLKAMKQWNNEIIIYLAYEIQESITDVLVKKTIESAKKYNVKSILLGGGVAANERLRYKFSIFNARFSIHIPPPKLCTDNGAVTASMAYFQHKSVPWREISARPDLSVEV